MYRLLAAATVFALLMTASTALAYQDEYDEYDDAVLNPFRMAYHLVYPVGYAVEWLVGRPFHYVISRPELEDIFGYRGPDDNRALSSRGM